MDKNCILNKNFAAVESMLESEQQGFLTKIGAKNGNALLRKRGELPDIKELSQSEEESVLLDWGIIIESNKKSNKKKEQSLSFGNKDDFECNYSECSNSVGLREFSGLFFKEKKYHTEKKKR